MLRCILILLLLLISGCSAYDSVLDKGKKALKNGNYDEAIHQFNNALIEKPQDTDAQILLNQSKEKYNEKIAIQEIDKYIEQRKPALDRFLKVANADRSTDKITQEELNLQFNELLLVREDLNKLSLNFNKNPKINDAHKLMIKTVEEFASGVKMMHTLLPDLKKEEEYKKNHPNSPHPIPIAMDVGRMETDFTNAKKDYAEYKDKINVITQGK